MHGSPWRAVRGLASNEALPISFIRVIRELPPITAVSPFSTTSLTFYETTNLFVTVIDAFPDAFAGRYSTEPVSICNVPMVAAAGELA